MKPLKVFFVDDESIVIEDLLQLIDWQGNQCNVVGYAHNAKQALSVIEQKNPDLIFMDISLPDMDGLSLSKKILQLLPNTTIVILSGYMDFQYAQKAIRLGLFNYLVKHELTVQKLKELLQEVRAHIQHTNRMQLSGRRQLLVECLHANANSAHLTNEYAAQLGVYQAPFSMALFVPIYPLCGLSNKAWIASSEKLSFLTDIADNIDIEMIDLLLLKNMLLVTFRLSSYDGSVAQKTRQQDAVIQRIQTELQHCFEFDFFALSYHKQSSCSSFIQNSQQLMRLHNQYYFHKHQSICYVEDMSVTSANATLSFITQANLQNDSQTLETQLQSTFQAIQRCRDADQFSDYIHRFAALFSLYPRLYAQLFADGQDLYIAQLLQDHFLRYFPLLQERKLTTKNFSSITKAVLQYIEQSYHQPISLSEIAEKLHSNSAYVGQRFRKDTDKTFRAYLTEYRIKQAKILLSTTNLKIAEITIQVGFESSQYFSTSFKELVGCTPNEYRRTFTTAQ